MEAFGELLFAIFILAGFVLLAIIAVIVIWIAKRESKEDDPPSAK